MDRNDDRAIRTQRRSVNPDEGPLEGFETSAPRRRRSQVARMRDDTMGDVVDPSVRGREPARAKEKSRDDMPRRSGRYEDVDVLPKTAPRRNSRYEDDYDDDYDDLDAPRAKKNVFRWVVILLIIVAILAGVTYVGLRRPDLIEPVIQWGRGLVSGPTPSPSPSPEPTPEPTPSPEPAPDLTLAVVIGFQANPLIQPDINQPITFQVTTTQQTTMVRIVDGNGQTIIEGYEEDSVALEYGRVWNLSAYFLTPYEGNVEAYPGNEEGWNESKGSSIPIQIGSAEAAPAISLEAPSPQSVDSAATVTQGDGVRTVEVTGQIVADNEVKEFFARENASRIGDADNYRGENGMGGVLTFRGSGMRQNAAYGTVSPTQYTLTRVWSATVGQPGDGRSTWGTQPLIVQWHQNIREMMELSPAKVAKSSLREVIFGGNDGQIYFLDLDDGQPSRSALPIEPKAPILGTPAMYPKGLPMIVATSGDPANMTLEGDTGLLVYNLLKNTRPVFIRSARPEAASADLSYITSPLIDNGNTMLISVGGNGVLYTMTLSPTIEPETKTLKFSPTLEMYITRAGDADMSVDSTFAAYGEFAYYATNGGILQCVNLNTLQTEWASNLGADTDAAIALETDYTGGPTALYTASRADAGGMARLRRINAVSGTAEWDVAVAGSSSSSPLIGMNGIGTMVIFTVNNADIGATMYALDKDTGEVVWEYRLVTNTSASPIALYTGDNNVLVVQGDGAGLHMVDGKTGQSVSNLALESPVIGSPAAFNNMIVVATQDGKLHGIQLD